MKEIRSLGDGCILKLYPLLISQIEHAFLASNDSESLESLIQISNKIKYIVSIGETLPDESDNIFILAQATDLITSKKQTLEQISRQLSSLSSTVCKAFTDEDQIRIITTGKTVVDFIDHTSAYPRIFRLRLKNNQYQLQQLKSWAVPIFKWKIWYREKPDEILTSQEVNNLVCGFRVIAFKS